jgi:gas vesicle protein
MSDGYDRFENEGGGGGSFLIGLLAGTVLGAGLGMLFAPRAGSELRSQLSDHAGHLANSASEKYRRASETAGEWAGKSRTALDKAREAVAKGAEEAQRYAREARGPAREGKGSRREAAGAAGGQPSGDGTPVS